MQNVSWLLIAVLTIGLALRCYHYYKDLPIWHDEAALIINAVGKDFDEHFGPLYFAEAAPPLFLSLEKSVSLLLGESALALRLVPFLVSCVALLALVWTGRPILTSQALLWFALLLACSDRLLWHCCEAKPYAVDVFVASLLLLIFVRYRSPALTAPADANRREQTIEGSVALQRECLLYAVLSPFLIFLSFPSCFLLGGIVLALAPSVWRRRGRTLLAWYSGYIVALVVSFLLLLLGPIAAQRNSQLESGWNVLFPHWERWWFVPIEMLIRLSEAGRYACEPVGNILILLALVGGIVLYRQRQYAILMALICPIALVCIAWLGRFYPMGPTRVMAFAAPAILLLTAAGCPPVWNWLRRRHAFAPILLAALLLVPAGYAVVRIVKPWHRADTQAALETLRRQRRPNEIVIGSDWQHIWYCRDLGCRYRTLVKSPYDPPLQSFQSESRDSTVRSCWLLLRQPHTQREEMALSRLCAAQTWTINQRHEFDGVTVFHLIRGS